MGYKVTIRGNASDETFNLAQEDVMLCTFTRHDMEVLLDAVEYDLFQENLDLYGICEFMLSQQSAATRRTFSIHMNRGWKNNINFDVRYLGTTSIQFWLIVPLPRESLVLRRHEIGNRVVYADANDNAIFAADHHSRSLRVYTVHHEGGRDAFPYNEIFYSMNACWMVTFGGEVIPVFRPDILGVSPNSRRPVSIIFESVLEQRS